MSHVVVGAGGAARTYEEMAFAVSLEPCASCGAQGLAVRGMEGEGATWMVQAACPRCPATQTFTFTTRGDPRTARAGRFELGSGASWLLKADVLRAVLGAAPADASGDARIARAAITCALVAATELHKLSPDDRAMAAAEEKRLRDLLASLAAAHTLSAEALAAHHQWVERGRTGSGQIVLHDASLADQVYGNVDLSWSALTRCELVGADFQRATFERATLEDVSFACSDLRRASFYHAVVNGGSFERADLREACLQEVDVRNADFSRADLEGVNLTGRISDSRFDGARFGDASIMGTTIRKTTFRNASFAATRIEDEPGWSNTLFEDCDLRGADFSGRGLKQTSFVRCQLAGARFESFASLFIAIESCDLDADQVFPTPHTLKRLVGQIFGLYREDRGPTTAEVRAKLEGPRRRVTTAGPNLDAPPWALTVGSGADVFVELEPDHEIAGVRIADDARGPATEIELTARSVKLADIEAVFGATKAPPRTPNARRSVVARPKVAGREVFVRATHEEGGAVIGIDISMPRAALAPWRPATPVELTPDTRPVATLDEGGERFEARRYDRDGVIDVVRYAGDGTILEKWTFTWDGQYMLQTAKIAHCEADHFVLEIQGQHWKGATPFDDAFYFARHRSG